MYLWLHIQDPFSTADTTIRQEAYTSETSKGRAFKVEYQHSNSPD